MTKKANEGASRQAVGGHDHRPPVKAKSVVSSSSKKKNNGKKGTAVVPEKYQTDHRLQSEVLSATKRTTSNVAAVAVTPHHPAARKPTPKQAPMANRMTALTTPVAVARMGRHIQVQRRLPIIGEVVAPRTYAATHGRNEAERVMNIGGG